MSDVGSPLCQYIVKDIDYKNEIICHFMKETLFKSLFRNLTFTSFFYK